jgi:hypothetical protein
MNRNLEKGVIEWYNVSTGFLTRKIYLTQEGIYIPRWLLGNIHIPYAIIMECEYFRTHRADTCLIKYIDEKGKQKTLRLWSCFTDVLGALKTYYSILIISRHQGHTIEQQLDRTFKKFVELLEDMELYVEFIKPTQIDLEVSFPGPRKKAYWKRELGTLKLKSSNIHSIKVTESGYAKIEYVQ